MNLLIKLARNLSIGLTSLWSHRLRSALTALGIVFGVASVVCMLSIGEGLSYEAREQIRRLGSNNILLYSVKPPQDNKRTESGNQVLQYGLTYADMERIALTVPKADVIIPSREIRKDIWFDGRRIDVRVIGTVPWYPQVTNAQIIAGRFFNSLDMHQTSNVCVLNTAALKNLRTLQNPLDGFVRVGSDYYRVIGVMESGMSTSEDIAGESKSQNLLYIPLTSAKSRFGEVLIDRRAGSMSRERVELHGAIVRVDDSDHVLSTAKLLEGILARFHDKRDYEMVVPLQLLQEKERIKRLYNIVLGLMAAISLIVGGIGIMNIMLATISERTPEIGIRRAIGAKRHDIMIQFLTETVLLSGAGGLLGIAIGIGLPQLITYFTKVATITTPWSVVLAFGISACVGIIFGFYPALRAANMDPIQALRHE